MVKCRCSIAPKAGKKFEISPRSSVWTERGASDANDGGFESSRGYMSETPDIDIRVGIEPVDAAVRKWISGYGPVKVNRLKETLKRHELEYTGCAP